MNKGDIIKEYIGNDDVDTFFKKNQSEFEQYHIINRKSHIKKGKLIKHIKANMRNLYEDNNQNLFLFCKRKYETADRTLSKIKCLAKPYYIFKLQDDELYLYGNSKLFFSSFKKYKKKEIKGKNIRVFEKQEKHIKENFNPSGFIDSLLKLNKDQKIHIYEILFNSLEIFNKKIRCQFSSELKKDDVLALLSKEELKNIFLKELNLSLLNSISFKDEKGNQETLKIREMEFGKVQFLWKRNKFSELRRKLSESLKIFENKTLIFISNGDLDSLFKEIEITAYKKVRIYNKTLQEYSEFISVKEGKVRINLINIVKHFKALLKNKYIVEEVKYITSNKLKFPSQRSKKRCKELLRIKDKGNKKIVTYLYLDECALYKNKNKFIRDFFIFMPCLIVDFRRKENDKYYISFGEFLKKLKIKDASYFEDILKENKKSIIEDIESISFKDLFDVVMRDILFDFSKYNKKLKAQRKGELYEKLVFILFSILFKVERLGGPNKHDGNIFVDNSAFIGYDTKNLTRNKIDSFLNKKTKKFKDKTYIKKNNIKHYFFIFENINETFFKTLVKKVKDDLKEEVYIKAFDIKYIKSLFDEINTKGIVNYSRSDKQNLINELLKKEDKIIK